MKLLELMLENNVVWPDGAMYAAQNSYLSFACTLFFYSDKPECRGNGDYVGNRVPNESRELGAKAEDCSTTIISWDEYLCAQNLGYQGYLDEMNKQNKIKQELNRKEIMHEICKIEPREIGFKSILLNYYWNLDLKCKKNKIVRDSNKIADKIIQVKYNISLQSRLILEPTLDVCYHIKHKNISITKTKKSGEDCLTCRPALPIVGLVEEGRRSSELTFSKDDIKLMYGDVKIDLGLFNLTEEKVIMAYVEERITDIFCEENKKELNEKEQKRKELINMFNAM